MMDKKRDLELIDRFLLGELSEFETSQIELRIEKEPDFKLLKEELEQLRSGIEAVGRKRLKDKMEAWDKEQTNPLIKENHSLKANRVQWRVYLGWAAVLVIGFSSVFFWYSSESQKSKRLYDSYFEVYDNVIVPIQRGRSEIDLEKRAFELYDLGEYEKAKPLFEELTKLNDADYVLFYQGMVLMSLKDWQGAEESLSQIKEDFKPQSDWFRALNAIGLGDLEKAKGLLNALEKGGSSYSIKAKEVLKKLE